MKNRLNRRDFFKKSANIGLAAALGGTAISQLFESSSVHASEGINIAVVKGADYLKNTINAVDLLGGIKKFVPKNSKVAILPNTQRWHPGTYTKPEIVRAVIRMCKEAGAKEINCLSCLDMKTWEATGLASAIEEEGASLKLLLEEELYKYVKVPKGKVLKEALIMKEFYNNDVFINIPITKDHAGNLFTGTMKNLMGLSFRPFNRKAFHMEISHLDNKSKERSTIEHLDQCIADLNTAIKPNLCIVDATEFIVTNGPMGPGDIVKPQKIIAGVDRVAIDAYCTTLWDIKAEEIIMINRAYEHGLGEIDLKKVKIKEINV